MITSTNKDSERLSSWSKETAGRVLEHLLHELSVAQLTALQSAFQCHIATLGPDRISSLHMEDTCLSPLAKSLLHLVFSRDLCMQPTAERLEWLGAAIEDEVALREWLDEVGLTIATGLDDLTESQQGLLRETLVWQRAPGITQEEAALRCNLGKAIFLGALGEDGPDRIVVPYPLAVLPPWFASLQSCSHLVLEEGVEIPLWIGRWQSLQCITLYGSHHNLEELPELRHLVEVTLHGLTDTDLTPLAFCAALQKVSIGQEALYSLPSFDHPLTLVLNLGDANTFDPTPLSCLQPQSKLVIQGSALQSLPDLSRLQLAALTLQTPALDTLPESLSPLGLQELVLDQSLLDRLWCSSSAQRALLPLLLHKAVKTPDGQDATCFCHPPVHEVFRACWEQEMANWIEEGGSVEREARCAASEQWQETTYSITCKAPISAAPRCLELLPRLASLSLNSSTPEVPEWIAACHSLRVLTLHSPHAGLERLHTLQHLRRLVLIDIEQNALNSIGPLSHLKELMVYSKEEIHLPAHCIGPAQTALVLKTPNLQSLPERPEHYPSDTLFDLSVDESFLETPAARGCLARYLGNRRSTIVTSGPHGETSWEARDLWLYLLPEQLVLWINKAKTPTEQTARQAWAQRIQEYTQRQEQNRHACFDTTDLADSPLVHDLPPGTAAHILSLRIGTDQLHLIKHWHKLHMLCLDPSVSSLEQNDLPQEVEVLTLQNPHALNSLQLPPHVRVLDLQAKKDVADNPDTLCDLDILQQQCLHLQELRVAPDLVTPEWAHRLLTPLLLNGKYVVAEGLTSFDIRVMSLEKDLALWIQQPDTTDAERQAREVIASVIRDWCEHHATAQDAYLELSRMTCLNPLPTLPRLLVSLIDRVRVEDPMQLSWWIQMGGGAAMCGLSLGPQITSLPLEVDQLDSLKTLEIAHPLFLKDPQQAHLLNQLMERGVTITAPTLHEDPRRCLWLHKHLLPTTGERYWCSFLGLTLPKQNGNFGLPEGYLELQQIEDPLFATLCFLQAASWTGWQEVRRFLLSPALSAEAEAVLDGLLGRPKAEIAQHLHTWWASFLGKPEPLLCDLLEEHLPIQSPRTDPALSEILAEQLQRRGRAADYRLPHEAHSWGDLIEATGIGTTLGLSALSPELNTLVRAPEGAMCSEQLIELTRWIPLALAIGRKPRSFFCFNSLNVE